MPKAWEIRHADSFLLDLRRAPKKVLHALESTIFPTLRSAPATADPPRIKRLEGYKRLWRLRVSDEYRLVYRVEPEEAAVIMLMLGHRKEIYERAGMTDGGRPGIPLVGAASFLLEAEPTFEATSRTVKVPTHEAEPTLRQDMDAPLPFVLDDGTLEVWGIPRSHWSGLTAVRTESELLGLVKEVPNEVLERVLNGFWPKPIEAVTEQPVRTSGESGELMAAAEGYRSLDSFLLHLDTAQRSFMARFETAQPTGPWILKGGPGSGKSTIAIYCIRSLLKHAAQVLSLDGRSGLKILFTTYTVALARSSEHLMQVLGGLPTEDHVVKVVNYNKLARQHLPPEWRGRSTVQGAVVRNLVRLAVCQCRDASGGRFPFSGADSGFLTQEIQWVILGRGIKTLEQYRDADRSGRGRPLGRQQRQHVWAVFEALMRRLRESNACLFEEEVQCAAERVQPEYDYVFIDEAQDLSPVALHFCAGLCRDRRNVFVTTDTNQSIYGTGLPLTSVTRELGLAVRPHVLRRNYRTTKEIWAGIYQLRPETEDVDQETIGVEPTFHGPLPVLLRHESDEQLGAKLNAFLHRSLLAERAAPDCAAVLCRSAYTQERVVKLLKPYLNAKSMRSSNLDLTHPGVKVLTIHAAKGLQFPIVAVVGVDEGVLPTRPAPGDDRTEHEAQERRLLFVACSRAMRRLLVAGDKRLPSPFLSGATSDCWETEVT
jgi:mRNA-degrading endonuclease RelE of RelBE toxin-antitoxin system